MALQPPYQFCTQFDHRYLPQGLVLYRSLQRHCRAFHLRAFCMDDRTKQILDALALPSLSTVSLDELERHDPGLLSIKGTRSRVEYYWTATPAICLYVLEHEPAVDHIVHLDTDLEFYADPRPLFEELGDGSILLVPHRASPEFSESMDETEESGGRFNVQFEVFRRDASGLAALRWWRERCLEWCYDLYEPDRYGDQKYLDDWPDRFAGVRVCENPGAGLAAWNVGRHMLERRGGQLLADGAPLVFHHFSSLELHTPGRWGRLTHYLGPYRSVEAPVPLIWTAGWRLTESELDKLWDPYVARLSTAMADLTATGAEIVLPAPPRISRVGFHLLRTIVPDGVRAFFRRVQRGWWRLRARSRRRLGTHPPPPPPPLQT